MDSKRTTAGKNNIFTYPVKPSGYKIDWLVFKVNFTSISAILWCQVIREDIDVNLVTGTGQKPPNNEIIIQSYYICFILMVIIKDILKN
jgi:hypothetical protein